MDDFCVVNAIFTIHIGHNVFNEDHRVRGVYTQISITA